MILHYMTIKCKQGSSASVITGKIFSDDAENPVTGLIQALEGEELEKIEIGEIFVSEVLRTIVPVLLLINLIASR